MSDIKIKGKAHFQNIGMGFWGIIGEDGQKWRPINMPEQLKKEGKSTQVVGQRIEEDFSIEMWGAPIRIVRFET